MEELFIYFRKNLNKYQQILNKNPLTEKPGEVFLLQG